MAGDVDDQVDDEVRRGRPRTVDVNGRGVTLSFRISGDDMDELLAAIDADKVTLSQLARVILHGWAEERRLAGQGGRRRLRRSALAR